mmetsp:Transcript_17109/g.47759  ORF Transcript_17109/g.47759 Transcript_17109/m.47759 type:complete len:646 (+) Transcript_17109:173-2110(+)|eukprot:CAMPEP_0117649386 /NCGR_PEP_ID=MMETSP0804-20121206/942_1 /TAXON_ID=1074897 /ORGANISM="Tetraselmis astigmatica, Strain CCMP880" /LENGTH=645 /DNA_ID=CAMNT_0005455115 /DNA_START=117 /DNA_END=2054 /DNA_ORIENTATION=-
MDGARHFTSKAEALAELLHASEYQGRLSVSGLKWAFTHPDTAAVLDWLCSQDLAAQVLSSYEQKCYEELDLQGRILQDQELTEVLHSAAALEQPSRFAAGSDADLAPGSHQTTLDPMGSPDFLLSLEQVLQQELQALNADHKALTQQRHSIREQLGSVRCTRQAAWARNASSSNAPAWTQSSSTILSDIGTVLEDIQSCGQQLGRLRSSDAGHQELLCVLPNASYVRTDLAYSQQLEDCRMKQPFKVPEALSSASPAQELDEELSRARLVYTAVAEGICKPTQHALQEELKRLKHAFKVGEHQRIVALAYEAQQMAELAEAQRAAGCEGLHSDGSTPIVMREAQASQEKNGTATTKHSEAAIMQRLPALLATVGDDQDATLLEVDYQDKIQRQSIYYEQKMCILRMACRQASWHKALELGLVAEAQKISQLREVVSSTAMELSGLSAAFFWRSAVYERLGSANNLAEKRLTIQSQDTQLHTLADVAISEVLDAKRLERNKLFRAASTDATSCSYSVPGRNQSYVEVLALHSEVDSLWELSAGFWASAASFAMQKEVLQSLVGCIGTCSEMMGLEAETPEQEMKPRLLSEAVNTLSSVNLTLSETVQEVSTSYTSKTDKGFSDGRDAARRVFSLFHTNQEKLLTVV